MRKYFIAVFEDHKGNGDKYNLPVREILFAADTIVHADGKGNNSLIKGLRFNDNADEAVTFISKLLDL